MSGKSFFHQVKSREESPAEAFISKPEEQEEKKQEAKPTGKNSKRWEDGAERKTVRVNLLFKPSVKEAAEKIAYLRKTSLNDFIGTLLEEYIEEHEDDIARYDSFFD